MEALQSYSTMDALDLRLPATSANLGPGFDALGLALDLWLEIHAEVADQMSIRASGRDADQVSSLKGNLILDTYASLAVAGPPLTLTIHNGIPLGMGCGSSAAALLAGVLLANHFGKLGWSDRQIVNEACRREGHPDNVAACFYGGLTASTMHGGEVTAASLGHTLGWRLLLASPRTSLATSVARSLLPDRYSRADAVANVQATALLMAAFSLDRPELLRVGTDDRLHQPYRMTACPLLEKLLPLAGNPDDCHGIYAVSLSGAGPSVLVFADASKPLDRQIARVSQAAGDESSEVLCTRVSSGYLGYRSAPRPRVTRD